MHELSVAMSLLDVITEEMIRARARRARSVTLLVGPLSGVIPEALLTAFSMATHDTELAGTTLHIRPAEVSIACETCGQTRRAVAANDLRCTVCNEPSINVVGGRELDLISIEVEDDNGTANPASSNQDPQG